MPNGDGTLYLLHFDRPYRHARHYLGFVHGGPENVEARVKQHLEGRGSPLVRAAVGIGITVTVERTWHPSDRTEERKLKNGKNVAGRLCPVCKAERRATRPRTPGRARARVQAPAAAGAQGAAEFRAR